MVKKVAVILCLIILLGIAVRWVGVVLDVCFAGLLVLFVWLLLREKKAK